jgi:hypothetical protein
MGASAAKYGALKTLSVALRRFRLESGLTLR